jgi:hypothetical protein
LGLRQVPVPPSFGFRLNMVVPGGFAPSQQYPRFLFRRASYAIGDIPAMKLAPRITGWCRIPRGCVLSYGDVGRIVGTPRRVAAAMRNVLPTYHGIEWSARVARFERQSMHGCNKNA